MLEMILLATLVSGDGRFFERQTVDFWDTRKAAAPPDGDLWADATAPVPVKRLLASPTTENARAYVDWQKARLERLRSAIAAVSRVSAAAQDSILYFSRPDCAWCVRQEKELEGLSVTHVPAGSPLWKRHGVTVTPTVIVRGRTFRGLTARADLLSELNHD